MIAHSTRYSNFNMLPYPRRQLLSTGWRVVSRFIVFHDEKLARFFQRLNTGAVCRSCRSLRPVVEMHFSVSAQRVWPGRHACRRVTTPTAASRRFSADSAVVVFGRTQLFIVVSFYFHVSTITLAGINLGVPRSPTSSGREVSRKYPSANTGNNFRNNNDSDKRNELALIAQPAPACYGIVHAVQRQFMAHATITPSIY